jgi:hypothetical protein
MQLFPLFHISLHELGSNTFFFFFGFHCPTFYSTTLMFHNRYAQPDKSKQKGERGGAAGSVCVAGALLLLCVVFFRSLQ